MATTRNGSVQIYDSFDKPGYSLTDHAEKWILPYGLGEMGTYESVGPGERAFPFQHPGAPGWSVSIPLGSASDATGAGRARLFGQGASGSFANFTTLTLAGTAVLADQSEIAMALSEQVISK